MNKTQSKQSLYDLRTNSQNSRSRSSVLDLVSEKSRTLRTAYDYEMDKFTNVTTFHGLIRWYNGNWKAKLFWTIIIGFAVTFFIIQSISSWNYYAGKPTVTTVEFVDQTNGSDFPAVTICNYNPVRESVVTAYNMSANVLAYIIVAYLQLEDMYVIYNSSTISSLHTDYQIYVNQTPGFSVNKFLMDAGYTCEEMFIDCTFGGFPMNCCQFAQPVITNMGKCFQFQNYSSVNVLNRQYISGPYYGFQAFINILVEEYPKDNAIYETGIRAIIHPRNSLTPVGAGGLSSSPGNKLYAGVTQTQYVMLPPEQWGQCKDKWNKQDFNMTLFDSSFKMMNKTWNDFDQYSTNNCEMICIAQHFIQQCGCIPLKYFNAFAYDLPLCDPTLNLKNCSMSFMEHGVTDNSMQKICPMCGIECERWNYNLQSSYIRISKAASQSMANRLNMTASEISENLVVLNVYLTDVNFVKYQQIQATSLTATLSAMGGNMGLFLGCSLVTCFEIIVFFVKLCYSGCWAKRRTLVTSKRTLQRQISANSVLSDITSTVPMRYDGGTTMVGNGSSSLTLDDDISRGEQFERDKDPGERPSCNKLKPLMRIGSVTFNLDSDGSRKSTDSNSEENIRKLTMENLGLNQDSSQIPTENLTNDETPKFSGMIKIMRKLQLHFSTALQKKLRSDSSEPIVTKSEKNINTKSKVYIIPV